VGVDVRAIESAVTGHKLGRCAVSVKESEVRESDSGESDSARPKDEDVVTTDPPENENDGKPDDTQRERAVRLTIPLRSLVLAVVIAILLAAAGVMTWLYVDARHDLDVQARQSEGNSHAENIALDYAVNAAAMNYSDLNAWKVKLVAGTSPELKARLTKAAEEMEQILVPLQWTSTARPLAAKVRSESNGLYVVDCFVSVLTKTVQAPDPLQSTATYSVTIDSNKNWQITDVGGIGAVVEQK
jgi:Mce-associated membrane protein